MTRNKLCPQEINVIVNISFGLKSDPKRYLNIYCAILPQGLQDAFIRCWYIDLKTFRYKYFSPHQAANCHLVIPATTPPTYPSVVSHIIAIRLTFVGPDQQLEVVFVENSRRYVWPKVGAAPTECVGLTTHSCFRVTP
jgi:hypothetical protein